MAGWGSNYSPWYYDRPGSMETSVPYQRSEISFDKPTPETQDGRRKMFYFRSAYRSEPEFRLESLSRVAPITENLNLQRMIENDATVLTNYQRIASQAVEDVLVHEQRNTTIGEYRDRIVGEIRQSMLALFPDLLFTDVGNPIDNGTFRFKKGEAVGFEYLNLSGGEKAAFDLLLDLIVKRRFYDDTVYCIDEPEMHLNARVQARLLDELMRLLPTSSQMWLATHSIGMMRKAKELAQAAPGTVTFLDFDKRDFDTPTILEPIAPTRAFWESALSVALDDLSSLVAPQELIVCEGNPTASVCGKNMALDAACYDTIFAVEKPDTKFLGSGSSGQVLADRLGFVAGISALVPGIAVKRLIDRDDHTPADVAAFKADGIRVLSRRNVESYIFDDEVLIKLCVESNKAGKTADILEAKKSAMAASAARGNPVDDVKSARGEIYNAAKRILELTGVGNDAAAFMRQTLAPLLSSDMSVYAKLRADIFGS